MTNPLSEYLIWNTLRAHVDGVGHSSRLFVQKHRLLSQSPGFTTGVHCLFRVRALLLHTRLMHCLSVGWSFMKLLAVSQVVQNNSLVPSIVAARQPGGAGKQTSPPPKNTLMYPPEHAATQSPVATSAYQPGSHCMQKGFWAYIILTLQLSPAVPTLRQSPVSTFKPYPAMQSRQLISRGSSGTVWRVHFEKVKAFTHSLFHG